MLTLIYFVLILGIVVFIHELGHFIFAKKSGVYVYEFSIGMGPRLFKYNRKPKMKKINGKTVEVKDETDYCIRLFPIGGFVQMAGEEIEVDEKIPEEKRLQTKKWHQRFMIMVAGVMNNFILAFIVLLIIGWTNQVSMNSVYVTGSLIKGLNDGDKIVEVNGTKVRNYDRLSLELTIQGKNKFDILVEDKKGKTKKITINPIEVGKDGLVKNRDYGFSIANSYNEKTNEPELIVSNSSLKNLKKNTVIVKVNDVSVTDQMSMLNVIKKEKKEITLTVLEKGKEKDITIKVKEVEDDLAGYSYGFYVTGTSEEGFLAGIKYAFFKFISTIEQMFFTVFYLITGKISLNLLSGPVGIYEVVGQASKMGFASILSLIALLNINVGFINILPLPAFDGGHALFLIIEKIKGSPVNPKVENIIHTIFLMLLMLLMIYVTFNDILRLF